MGPCAGPARRRTLRMFGGRCTVEITAVVSRRAKGGAVAEPLVGTAVVAGRAVRRPGGAAGGRDPARLLAAGPAQPLARTARSPTSPASGRPGPLPRRLSIEFYQVALFFVIFDLEAVFIFAWAVNARSAGLDRLRRGRRVRRAAARRPRVSLEGRRPRLGQRRAPARDGARRGRRSGRRARGGRGRRGGHQPRRRADAGTPPPAGAGDAT